MRDPYTGLPQEDGADLRRPSPVEVGARPPALDLRDDPNALVAQVAEALAEPRYGTLAQNLVAFGELLKLAGLDVTTGRLIDAAQSLTLINIAAKADFRLALKANLLSAVEDEQTFDTLFELFWRLTLGEPNAFPRPQPVNVSADLAKLGTIAAATRRQDRATGSGAAPRPKEGLPQSYSGDDIVVSRDFSDFRGDEVRQARRLIRRLAPKLATAVSRRQRSGRTGDQPDLRRSLRRATGYGGEVLEVMYRRRKVRKLKLVLLCDVSGSMDTYARFLVQFLYSLQNEVHSVSTFVFSTRLFEVTHLLKRHTFEAALDQIAQRVDGWSGGTNIGGSLHTFNHVYGKRRVDSRTVVVVISDGWDRGDIALLVREMQWLKRRAYKVLWLNPLLGHPHYQPLCRGMAAALPYIDYFLPAHNLASLVQVGRTLVHLART